MDHVTGHVITTRYQYCIEMLYNCSNKHPSRNYKKEYGVLTTMVYVCVELAFSLHTQCLILLTESHGVIANSMS